MAQLWEKIDCFKDVELLAPRGRGIWALCASACFRAHGVHVHMCMHEVHNDYLSHIAYSGAAGVSPNDLFLKIVSNEKPPSPISPSGFNLESASSARLKRDLRLMRAGRRKG